MISKRILGTTRELAKNQPEYNVLCIRDIIAHGKNFMQSAWEPTPLEVTKLMAGGRIVLSIMGTVHPPVLLEVYYEGENDGGI